MGENDMRKRGREAEMKESEREIIRNIDKVRGRQKNRHREEDKDAEKEIMVWERKGDIERQEEIESDMRKKEGENQDR